MDNKPFDCICGRSFKSLGGLTRHKTTSYYCIPKRKLCDCCEKPIPHVSPGEVDDATTCFVCIHNSSIFCNNCVGRRVENPHLPYWKIVSCGYPTGS